MAKSNEFNRYCQKLMEAPEPPSAMASAGDLQAEDALERAKVEIRGETGLPRLAARDPLVERAVRITQ